MKRIITAMAFVCLALSGFAQEDSVTIKRDTAITNGHDTIRVGNMIIIRSERDGNTSFFDSTLKRFRSENRNITTNWFIIDLGVSQINDQTNYAEAIANGYLPAGANEDWFNQRNLKSTNVNIWIFMQRLNMISHVVNLKYGLGVELNNYKYTEDIKFQETTRPLVIMDAVNYRKNKLAADYITVPIMLNFNFTPRTQHGFGISAGISAGYLYSSRQKTEGGDAGKKRFRDDYDLSKFKLSYIGEISLGPVRLYGSYAMNSMFENSLDQTPYNFGIRLSK